MRYSVFLALVIATIVASCGSFISAETDARGEHASESTEVRRLREDPEERGFLDWLMATLTYGLQAQRMGPPMMGQSTGNAMVGTGNAMVGTGNGMVGTGNGMVGTGNGMVGTGNGMVGSNGWTEMLRETEKATLSKHGICVNKLRFNDPNELSKVARLALEAIKKEKNFKQLVKRIMYSIGGAAVVCLLYQHYTGVQLSGDSFLSPNRFDLSYPQTDSS